MRLVTALLYGLAAVALALPTELSRLESRQSGLSDYLFVYVSFYTPFALKQSSFVSHHVMPIQTLCSSCTADPDVS